MYYPVGVLLLDRYLLNGEWGVVARASRASAQQLTVGLPQMDRSAFLATDPEPLTEVWARHEPTHCTWAVDQRPGRQPRGSPGASCQIRAPPHPTHGQSE